MNRPHSTRSPRHAPSWRRRRLFLAAMLLKGADGVLETIGGGLLALFGPQGVSRTVTLLTRHELAEDPADVLAGWLVRHAWHVGETTIHFATAYLVIHGLVKLVLVVGLLRRRRWAFPTALMFLGLFVLYQAWRLIHRFSAGLAFLAALDVAIILIVWREYHAFENDPAGPGTARA